VPPSEKVYVRPLGLIAGATAAAATAAGFALPLGGRASAFTACQIFRRRGSEIVEQLLPVSRLDDWPGRAGEPVAAQVKEALARLTAPISWPPGLPAEPPLIMGVLNVTPDSFSDGGRFVDPGAAIEQGLRMWHEGAAIVDVGGESTRPGAAELPAEEELRRVVPVIEALYAAGVRVSIDTRKAAVMRRACAAGAAMINDVSALRHDPLAMTAAAGCEVPVVLMHSRGEPATMQADPTYERAALDVFDHLEERIDACVRAGIARERLIVDPGIGFGKTLAHNLDILHHLVLYRSLGAPVLLGASRKSFIARLAGGAAVDARLPGSLAAALFGILNETAILRVHDVAATLQALRVWRAMTL